jgi:hypothetical protein
VGEHPGAAELIDAVRWLIIRAPRDVGQLIPGRLNTYAVRTKDFMAIGLPEVIIVYSLIDHDNLVLEIVDVVPASEEQADVPLSDAV